MSDCAMEKKQREGWCFAVIKILGRKGLGWGKKGALWIWGQGRAFQPGE